MISPEEQEIDSRLNSQQPVVRQVGDKRRHERWEQQRVDQFYDSQRRRAEQLGVDPTLVSALEAVEGAVGDIKRQRALAEEMGPKTLPQRPHSHN